MSLQSRHGQRLTVALLSHCLYALGLSVKGSWGQSGHCLSGPGLFLVLSACQGPRGTFHGPLQAPEALGLKHTLEGQFPWVQDSRFTAPLSSSGSSPRSSGLSLVSPVFFLPSKSSAPSLWKLSEVFFGRKGHPKGTANARLASANQADLWVRALLVESQDGNLVFWELGVNVGAGQSSCFPLLTQDSFWAVLVTSPRSHLRPTHRCSAGRT